MAQIENFVMENGTGAAVRADINRALMALATTNTGATAPLNPVFGMLWVDTTNECLKIYAGDDVWLIITDSIKSTALSGSMTFPSGTQMVFRQATIPPGWGQAAYDDYALRVVSGAPGGVQGNVGFSSWSSAPLAGYTSADVDAQAEGQSANVLTQWGSTLQLKYLDVMICTKA
jgi:hypothetical protein